MNLYNKIKSKIFDSIFFCPRWYAVFLNPYFISRYSLYKQMVRFAISVGAKKRILDIGCGIKPYQTLFRNCEYVGIDIQGGGHADVAKFVDRYYDGDTIPYGDAEFDVIICTQVLEHATNPERVIQESYRVLKPGGTVIYTLPMVYPEHEIPYDFRRFTRYGLEKYFNLAKFHALTISQTSGLFGVMGQLFSVFIFESFNARNFILKSFKFFLVIFLLAPIQILSLLLDKIFKYNHLTLDYVVVANK